MKYSGASIVTTYQVGATVYVIENDIPRVCTVKQTESKKVGAGSVQVWYRMNEFPNQKFATAEVFASLSDAKTHFSSLDAV